MKALESDVPAQPDQNETRRRNIRRHAREAKVLLAAARRFVGEAADSDLSIGCGTLDAAEQVLGLIAEHLDSIHGLAAVRQ